jgi:AraC-like DNA-binding protein
VEPFPLWGRYVVNDLSHFGRIFVGKMHMTPSQWRRRAQYIPRMTTGTSP